MDAWNHQNTAKAYARLTQTCPFYSELAVTLAEHLLQPGDRFIVDLGAGIGVSTAPLRRAASIEADIWAVDPADAMLSYGRENENLHGVRWFCGDIEALAVHRPRKSVDVISCSAATWLKSDFEAFLGHAVRMLSPNGRLGFTLPAEYVGEIEHLLCPESIAFSRAVNQVRSAAYGGGDRLDESPNFGSKPLPSSIDGLEDRMIFSGFSKVQSHVFEASWTAYDRALWYSLPPVLNRWLNGCSNDVQEKAARDLRARAQELPPVPVRWVLVSGTFIE